MVALRRPARRTLVVGALGLALAVGALQGVRAATGGSSGGHSSGGNNVAVATNTKDGSTVYALRLKVVQTSADTVDTANAAVAAASCTGCTTVAIALEGVIVVGSPSTFTPVNVAVAVNSGCSSCQTLASAYQTVVQTSTRVRISHEGRTRIAELRRELKDLRTSGLPITEVQSRVAAINAAFVQVLQTQLVPVGHHTEEVPADAPDVSDQPDAAPAAAGAASPAAASGSASPTPSATASVSPSTGGSPTASPSATASPTASSSASTSPTASPSPSGSPTPS